MFEFKDLISSYSVSFLIEFPALSQNSTENDLDDYDELGNLIEGDSPAAVSMVGALIPLSSRAIYNSGGRLTEADRTLYSTFHDIPMKSKIMYKGVTYQVVSKIPLEDYADFSQYTLKGVDSFG